MLLLVALLVFTGCDDDSRAEVFEGLTSGTRVYDQTGKSLTGPQIRQIQRKLDTLQAETGADAIAYVREFDADSEETLDQVEALQQVWVKATGSDQDVAVAILINREPGTDNEARAGIFVGSTFHDGNVPTSEQEAIVDDELIPPLRDGNVFASLSGAIDGLDHSIRNGPPVTALNDFAAGPGASWLPWVGLALVVLLALAALQLYRKRAKPTRPEQEPTLRRPGNLNAGLAAVLITGAPQATVIPATILELAVREGLVIEQEESLKKNDDGALRLRLLNDQVPRDDVERHLWKELREQAEDGLVDSAKLQKLAQNTSGIHSVIKDQARLYGWLNDKAPRTQAWLLGLAVIAGVLLAGSLVVVANGAPLMLISAMPALLLVVLCVVFATTFSRLSVPGLDAARPWVAYRDGLKKAGKDEAVELDLDAVLTDVIAFNLGGDFDKRLAAATDGTAATTLQAFTPLGGAPTGMPPAILPWAIFSGAFVTSGGAGVGVSGAGAGGGGGAAGGT